MVVLPAGKPHNSFAFALVFSFQPWYTETQADNYRHDLLKEGCKRKSGYCLILSYNLRAAACFIHCLPEKVLKEDLRQAESRFLRMGQ